MSARAVLPIAVVLVPGCLSPRDNPLDPVNRPVASLRILDRGAPGPDGCPDSGGTPVGIAPRAHCLVLDASGTSDPNDDALSILWRIPGEPPADAVPDPMRPLEYALDQPLRERLSLGTALTFAIDVDDGEGGRASAEETLVLTNAPPSIDDVRPLRLSLPGNGWPWAAGEPVRVRFDASSAVDPDGDTLRWCWQFPGDEQEACGAASVQERDVPPSDEPYTALVRVRDGSAPETGDGRTLSTRRLAFVVRFGETGLWTLDGAGTPNRLAPDVPRTVAESCQALPRATFLAAGATASPRVVMYRRSDSFLDELLSIDWRTGETKVHTQDAGPPPDVLIADRSGMVFGARAVATPEPILEIQSWAIDAAGQPAAPSTTVLQSGASLSQKPIAAVSGGQVWTAALAGGELWRGPPYTEAGTAGDYRAVATRPDGSGEVWALAKEGAGFVLETYDPTGALLRTATLGSGAIGSFHWFGPDEIALAVPGGLEHRDARTFQRLRTVVAPDCTDLVLDPFSGMRWCRDLAVTAGGDVIPFDQATVGGGIHFVDPLGGLHWLEVDPSGCYGLYPRYFLRRTHTLDPHGALARAVVEPAPFLPGARISAGLDGTLWLQPLDPTSGGTPMGAGLAQLAEDGSLLRFVTAVRDAQGDLPVADLALLRIAPDGGTAWLVQDAAGVCEDVSVLDLTTDPPGRTVAAPGACIAGDLLEPFTPQEDATERAWASSVDGSGRTIGVLTAAGFTAHAQGLLPASESNLLVARSLRTDALCAVTREFSGALNMRWFEPDGTTVENFAVDTLPAGQYPVGLALSPDDAGGDLCWVAIYADVFEAHQVFVRAFDRTGATVRDYGGFFEQGGLSGFTVTSPDTAWITLDLAGATEGMRYRIDFDPVDPMVVTTSGMPVAPFTGFVSPEAHTLSF